MSIFIGLRPEGYDFSFKKRSPHFILVEESGTNTLDKFGTKLEKYTPKTVAIKQMKICIISMKPIEKSQHIVNNCNNCSVFIVWL